MSQKNPLLRFSDIFLQNGWEVLDQILCTNYMFMSTSDGWEFLVKILHTYYAFLSTLDYKFLFNYLQLWRSYAILSATTQRAFRPMVDISTFEHDVNCVVARNMA